MREDLADHRVDPTIQCFACGPLQTGSSERTSRATAIPGSLVAVTRDIPLTSRVAYQRGPLDHALPELGDRRSYSRFK